jgi:hypothetical protein
METGYLTCMNSKPSSHTTATSYLNTYTKTRLRKGRHSSIDPSSILRRHSLLALTLMSIHPILATSASLQLRSLWDHKLAKYEITKLLRAHLRLQAGPAFGVGDYSWWVWVRALKACRL